MNHKLIRKIVLFSMASVLYGSLFSMPVYANSAPIFITDGDAFRGVVPREKSPLEVEKEILCFDIEKLEPEDTDYDILEAIERSGTVTAEYHFLNPTDESVYTRLAFAQGVERQNTSCDVRIDDVALETAIRYTRFDEGAGFFGPNDVQKIGDEYIEDEFFYPEMPVTEYCFQFDGLSEEKSVDAVFRYDMPDPAAARIVLPCYADESAVYARRVQNGEEFSVYVIGEKEGIELSFDTQGKPVRPKEGSQMRFAEFVAASMGRYPQISDIDLYNIVVEELNACRRNELILSHLPNQTISTTMWIEYAFTLEPHESAVNTVKAVLAPKVHNYRKKPEFTYHYLLSPAQCWKRFGSLDIEIHTPHAFYEEETDGFASVEGGYIKHYDSLPAGEVSFSLTFARKGAKADPTGEDSDIVHSRDQTNLFSGMGNFSASLIRIACYAAVGFLVLVILIIVIAIKASKKDNKK